MKQVLKFIFVPIFLGIFQGCSWVEYFVVLNQSDKAIYVHYELAEDPKGISIFYDHPNVYPLNSSDDIVWGVNMSIADEDSSRCKVSIALPPHSALIFGGLHNSTYKSYDQQFINGRVFDLQKLQVLHNNKTLDIVPSNFDAHFKKKQGRIRLIIE